MAVSEGAVQAAKDVLYYANPNDVERALTAAVPHLAAVRVKKLEWHGPDYEDEYWASWLGGRYTIQANTDDGRWLSGVGGNFQSVDAAKAAAQADYEARILSALEPSNGRAAVLEDGDLKELVERLDAGLQYEGSMDTEEGGTFDIVGIEAAQDLFADAAAAIRALSSPDHADAGKVEGDGWLPIESAPKDGTVIDLWSDEYGRLTDCYWGSPMAYEGGETGWVHAHSNEWAESPDEFVHWRPLPSAPSEGAE